MCLFRPMPTTTLALIPRPPPTAHVRYAGRLLLIEDNPGDARLIREALNDAGPSYELVTRDRLQNGVAALAEQPMDLVLLDLGLPDSQGTDTLRLALAQANGVPIVVLTGLDDEATAVTALRAGAQDYLVKGSPDPRLVVRTVQYAIERNRILNRLKEADRLKSEFVSMASHELRTPLAIIREFASLVRDGMGGPVTTDQADWLDTVLRNCDRLGRLLGEALDEARIEAGAFRVSRSSCLVDAPLGQWIADFAPRVRASHQSLTLEILGAPLPAILCDVEKLEQVVVNLLENAHKFSGENGRITVCARRAGAFVEIAVEDDGVGIAPADHSRIFEAFTQIDRTNGPGAKGTGLGLTIARKIVELHGGSLTLKSDAGRGARFALTIPIDDDPSAATPPAGAPAPPADASSPEGTR
jgi:signal transduction histidine kinase